MWFFKKKIKEDWKLVGTLEGKVHWTDVDVEESIYYYLYENNFRNRRIEIKQYGYSKNSDKAHSHTMYLTKVYPWSKGQDFDGIPSYWQVFKYEKNAYIKELYRRIIGK